MRSLAYPDILSHTPTPGQSWGRRYEEPISEDLIWGSRLGIHTGHIALAHAVGSHEPG